MTLQIHANISELLENIGEKKGNCEHTQSGNGNKTLSERSSNGHNNTSTKTIANSKSFASPTTTSTSTTSSSSSSLTPLQSSPMSISVVNGVNKTTASNNNNNAYSITNINNNQSKTIELESTASNNLFQHGTSNVNAANNELSNKSAVLQVCNNSLNLIDVNDNENDNNNNNNNNTICDNNTGTAVNSDTAIVTYVVSNNVESDSVGEYDKESLTEETQTELVDSVEDDIKTYDKAGYPISYFNAKYIGRFSLDHEINCLLVFVKDIVAHMEETRLPWRTDFADPDKLRRPKKMDDALTRLNLNVPYYDGNYLEIFYGVTIPFLFFYNLVFLCVLLVICAVLHNIALHRRSTGRYGSAVYILGRRMSYRRLGHYLLLAILVLCVCFNGVWTLIWVGVINAAVIIPHGLWRLPTYFDDEDLEKLRPKLMIQLFSFLFIVLSYLEGDVSGPEDEGKRAAEREMQRLGMTQIHFRRSKHWKRWQRQRHRHHHHQPLPGEVQHTLPRHHKRHHHHHHSNNHHNNNHHHHHSRRRKHHLSKQKYKHKHHHIHHRNHDGVDQAN